MTFSRKSRKFPGKSHWYLRQQNLDQIGSDLSRDRRCTADYNVPYYNWLQRWRFGVSLLFNLHSTSFDNNILLKQTKTKNILLNSLSFCWWFVSQTQSAWLLWWFVGDDDVLHHRVRGTRRAVSKGNRLMVYFNYLCLIFISYFFVLIHV